MNKDKYCDVYAGGFLVVLGLFLLISSFSIPKGAAVTIGSDFMPKVVSAVLTVLGIIIVRNGIAEAKTYREPETKPVFEYKNIILSLIALLVYMLLLVPVGFLIMTTIYIGVQAMILAPKEKRNPVLFFVIGFASAFVIYFLFRNVFSLMLPSGLLRF